MPGSASNPIPFFQLRAGGQFRAREPHVVPQTPSVGQHFSEFYCTSGGSNLNAGSTQDNSAVYTSTNGSWSTTTNIFTPTDGTNPWPTVQPGMFASVYIDGASVAVYIARITQVNNATNGGITLSTTAVYGTAPATSATTRTIKVGGAWLGPNGTSNFPYALSGLISNLQNTRGEQVRVNLKNDQTYVLTAQLVFSTLGLATTQGYSTLPGDGGKATLTSNITGGANFTTGASSRQTFVDLVFANTGALNTNDVFGVAVQGNHFLRCVFHGGRGSGLSLGIQSSLFAIECEAYDCNKSNTAALAGFSTSTNGHLFCINCYSHDHTAGANAHGFCSGASGGFLSLINCIIDTVSGNGVLCADTGTGANAIISINGSYYNIAADGIKFANTLQGSAAYLVNNSFSRIGGRAVNNTLSTQSGIIYNNARSDIGAIDALTSITDSGTDIRYPVGTTQWNAPDTGDFSTVLSAAIAMGRGAFTQTDGTNSGTVGYPDIGAAQAQATTQSFAVTTGIQTLPFGYVGYIYGWKWNFPQPTTVTLQSGTIPPGLTLSASGPNTVNIIGTPTTPGIYDFVLRATVGTSTGDANFEITVRADPDEGIGGLLGGLRPTC